MRRRGSGIDAFHHQTTPELPLSLARQDLLFRCPEAAKSGQRARAASDSRQSGPVTGSRAGIPAMGRLPFISYPLVRRLALYPTAWLPNHLRIAGDNSIKGPFVLASAGDPRSKPSRSRGGRSRQSRGRGLTRTTHSFGNQPEGVRGIRRRFFSLIWRRSPAEDNPSPIRQPSALARACT